MLDMRVKKQEKDLNHLLRLCKDQKKHSLTFDKRLTLAIERNISDLIAKKALIESLAFENDNSERKG